MTDFLIFTEGDAAILEGALKAGTTVYFLLSVDAVSSLTSASTLAGGVGEIAGTAYARQSQAAPAVSGGNQKAFAQVSWATGSATDWPSAVRSVIAATSPDNTGHAICAWNLVTGGAARDMSAANTTEQVTPTYSLS
jgi:hypothetical protein